jgi:two-component system chemotaxis sensor kinase CheA
MMEGFDEIIGEFLVESRENLDRLDLEFIELENAPESRELLASIFRTIHTIKGTAGFLGLDRLEAVSHVGESLLSKLRDGVLTTTPDMVSALLGMVDAIREMLDVVEANGDDGSESYAELTSVLQAHIDGTASAAVTVETIETVETVETVQTVTTVETVESIESVESVAAVETVATPAFAPAPAAAAPVPAAPAPAATPAAAETPEHEPTGASAAPSTGDTSIRVDVRLLDQLMNLVGELVLARNQILQYTSLNQDPTFVNSSQQLNLITTELQEGVMKTRMQPIGNIWSKFPRVVRDLAIACDKQVRIEMEGEETELDKTILEAIKDPLTHVVRNSVDHGIESPAEREAAGKPAEGTLRLRAFHEGGQVIIEMSDDGGGLDMERIRSKAVERGLVTAEQAGRMGERETANLIFMPGFSTAAAVTNVSGRGVGMDVVKSNIEKIGGTVDVQSTQGHGTTLTVKIPLTLAIIPALVVSCDDANYAIPQVNLVELLRVDPAQDTQRIEYVGDAPVYRLRGRLLPVVHLREILGLEPVDTDEHAVNVVVLQADDRQFGLVVDQVNDTEEIVVKPLGPHLKALTPFAGTTIMGDGAVALILDAIGIAQEGNVISEVRERLLAEDTVATSGERSGDSQTVVVFDVAQRRIAIPLAFIDRLEEIPTTSVERISGAEVVQYRGKLLTLLSLRRYLDVDRHVDPFAEPPESGMLQVLVYSTERRVYGLIVDEILDIVETDTAEAERGASPTVQFSGVIGRRVTDLINIEEIIRMFERDHGLVGVS